MEIHRNLKALAEREGAHDWLARLPILIEELSAKWELQLANSFPDSTVSFAIAAVRRGKQVVLKIQWPHPECELEAEALRIWNGYGAVRLLDHDLERHALLLERCLPGTHLSQSRGTDQIGVMIELLPRLWKRTSVQFQSLEEESQSWAANMERNWTNANRPCERELIDAALHYIETLSNSQSEQVLVHQDLHGDNVIASKRDGWLAIDPKPLVGEREFALSPVIRSFEFGGRKQDVHDRLNRLTTALCLDRERTRGWAIAQSIAWSFGSEFAQQHYQTARWLHRSHP